MRYPIRAALLLAAAVLVTGPAEAQETERQFVDGIAAIVGNEIVLESEVDEELYIYHMRTGGKELNEERSTELRRQILAEMIDEMLLVAKARRDSIVLAEGELTEEIEVRVRELRERYGSEEALLAALEAEGLTLSELKDIYRDDIESRLLAEKVVRQEVHGRIDVTWGDVETYYQEHAEEVARLPESYEVAGILVAPEVSEEAKRRAFDRLNEARTRLESGAPFAEVAEEFSEDASASRGGELGFVERGQTVPEFESALFALEPGEVSGIVPSRFGFHIIQAVERDGERVRARHILARVAPGEADDARARAEAESLRALVASGDDFSELATEHSDDEATAAEGGYLGWFTAEQLSPEFIAALDAIEPGEVTDVIRGDGGYYLLKLLAHEDERVAELDEVREELRDLIFSQRAEAAYEELMRRLRSEIFIDLPTEPAAGG
jgi:peptidyl-prolyl cis-trans isomerase SurA